MLLLHNAFGIIQEYQNEFNSYEFGEPASYELNIQKNIGLLLHYNATITSNTQYKI